MIRPVAAAGVRSWWRPSRYLSSPPASGGLAGHGVDVPERSCPPAAHRILRNVALHGRNSAASTRGRAPCRSRSHVVRRADRDGLRELGLGARVAIQALVEVLVDLVAVDAVRNGRRLHVVAARPPHVVVHGVAEQRRLGGSGIGTGPRIASTKSVAGSARRHREQGTSRREATRRPRCLCGRGFIP